jgi:hypothetical protein
MEGPGFVLDGDEGATSPPHRHGAPTADEEGLERARFPHHRPDVDRQVGRRSREPARHLNSLSVGSASDRLPQTPTPGLTVIAATRTCAERRSATTSAKVTRAPFAATTTGRTDRALQRAPGQAPPWPEGLEPRPMRPPPPGHGWTAGASGSRRGHQGPRPRGTSKRWPTAPTCGTVDVPDLGRSA